MTESPELPQVLATRIRTVLTVASERLHLHLRPPMEARAAKLCLVNPTDERQLEMIGAGARFVTLGDLLDLCVATVKAPSTLASFVDAAVRRSESDRDDLRRRDLPVEVEGAVLQLRAFVRAARPGGCRMFSQGSDCRCPLCAIDTILDWAQERVAARETVGADPVAESPQLRAIRHAEDEYVGAERFVHAAEAEWRRAGTLKTQAEAEWKRSQERFSAAQNALHDALVGRVPEPSTSAEGNRADARSVSAPTLDETVYESGASDAARSPNA